MKILIVTALSLEFEAVKKYLTNIKPVTHPSTGSIYDKGDFYFEQKKTEVLIVETGAGNVRAADETGRAIEFFKPKYVFFVGVAGGIKDVTLGDVVASTKVIGFEVGKADVEFKPRFDSVPSSYILEQIAKYVKREKQWIKKISSETSFPKPESYVQPIAAGEKVISSNRSEVFKYITQYCSETVAVDMEGIGFLIAARAYNTHAIEVRGISDLIENKAESDASGTQLIAARNAAAFTFEMIGKLLQDLPITKNIYTIEFQNKLVNKLVNLYPQGPEQENIWKRAGGDISILINSSSRKSQWFDAIDKLKKGMGGKNITLESLLDTINEDIGEVYQSFQK